MFLEELQVFATEGCKPSCLSDIADLQYLVIMLIHRVEVGYSLTCLNLPVSDVANFITAFAEIRVTL